MLLKTKNTTYVSCFCDSQVYQMIFQRPLWMGKMIEYWNILSFHKLIFQWLQCYLVVINIWRKYIQLTNYVAKLPLQLNNENDEENENKFTFQ